MRLTLLLVMAFFVGSLHPSHAADPIAELQTRIKTIADTNESSVVALVISHNPLHGSIKDERPWELGEYVAVPRFERGGPWRRQQLNARAADPLDISDIRNAANYTVASAVVLDAEKGLLLTTAHLLDGARKVYVRFPGGNGTYANIHAADFRADLAVLKLLNTSPKLRPIKIADVRLHSETPTKPATVSRGDWVISLAHVFGVGLSDGSPSVSWGVLSNIGRKGTLPPGTEDVHPGYLTQYSSLLQTDARITLGSSGGALLNLEGELIGLTSAAAGLAGSESAGGFAIPMDPIYRGIINVLKRGTEVEYGFLGVTPGGMTQGEPIGLMVSNVTQFSGAQLAGMQNGDVITSVNGRPLRDESDLYLLVGGALAGNSVTLGISRYGKSDVARPRLGKFQHPYPHIASVKPPAIYGLRVDYSSIIIQQAFGPGARFGVSANGVVIRELEKDSPAERVFQNNQPMQGRWIITKVDGIVVTTPTEFYNAVGQKQQVKLSVVGSMDPSGRVQTVTLP